MSILEEFGEHQCEVCGTDCVEAEAQFDERTKRIAALLAVARQQHEALRVLLETHCCDSGEVDYVNEWDGDHTVCPYCTPTHAALAAYTALGLEDEP